MSSDKSHKYLTPDGYARMKARLNQLLTVERPVTVQAVSEAAAMGDRSENAEYIYGKKRLREIDREIRRLSNRLEGAVVIDQLPSDRSRIYFGAHVVLEDDTGTQVRLRIVGVGEPADDADFTAVSIHAPMARALVGKTYDTQHYNLSAIIAVGYKVNSQRAVQFRKWATGIVEEFAIKGYTMDDERLKQGGSVLSDRYFEEQLQRVREIRLSERKFYQKITDLYATAIDYDVSAQTTQRFFATVQNKLPMTMQDWETRLNRFIEMTDRKVLQDAGKVSAEIARAHAEAEFEKYRIVQDRLFESDFDRMLKKLEMTLTPVVDKRHV